MGIPGTSSSVNATISPAPSAVPSPISPHTVLDPLHTGLTQVIQVANTTAPTTNNSASPANRSAISNTSPRVRDLQRLYADYIEDEIERSEELILASRTKGRASEIPTWQALAEAIDTSALRALLSALAFDLGASDPWEILGFSRLEGPKPTTHTLISRRDVATKIVDSCAISLSAAAQDDAANIQSKLQKACYDCNITLEAVLRERRSLKGAGRNVPRWMEPSPQMYSYLKSNSPQPCRMALHLSNLRGAELGSGTHAADVITCRSLHSHLCGPMEEIERALTHWGDRVLVTWAPTDNGQLLKVAAAARKLFNSQAGQAHLVLAVPFDPYPAFEKVSDITDVWDHPLLHDKWRDVLVDVHFLIPPSRIIVSGSFAPIHAQKCLALFTLGLPGLPAVPRLTNWQPKFFSFASGPVINVDVLGECRYAVRGIISTMGLPAVLAIDHPKTSLGSTREAPRAVIQIHIGAGQISPLHMEALLRWLHGALQNFQVIVGLLNTMASPTAMLLDCMATAAGHLHAELCWSSLVISPRLILIESRTDAQTWNASLSSAWNVNPNEAGIKVRYRPSSGIKKAFAHVDATATDIAAVRARKAHANSGPSPQDPPTLQATISMPLGTCGPLEQWLPVFMANVASTNGLPLERSRAEAGLDIHKWRAIMGYDGSWTGKVIIQLATLQELQNLHTFLHGQGIEIQHHLTSISVDSLHYDFSAQAQSQSR